MGAVRAEKAAGIVAARGFFYCVAMMQPGRVA
jgi:hypothetical protein